MILRASISFIVCILLSWAVAAQHSSKANRFTTDVIKGCQPLTVTTTPTGTGNSICDGTHPCTINYDEGAGYEAYGSNNVKTKTYNTPGKYKLHILFGSTGVDTIHIEVTAAIPPTFDLYSCGNGTVVTKITDTNYYDEYAITYNTPPIQTPTDNKLGKGGKEEHVFGVSGLQTVSVRGRKLPQAPAPDNYEDNCPATIKTIDTSAPITPASLSQLAVTTPAQLQLDLASVSDVTLYKLQIANNSTTAASFRNFLDVFQTNTVTVDNLQTDNNFYCFRLGMFNPCANSSAGAIVSFSDVICSVDLDAAAQSDANKLTWRTAANGISNYSITKSDPDAAHSPLSVSPPATQTLDTDVICKTDYTYQLTANYSNGSRSLSLPKMATAFSTRQPPAPKNISAVVTSDNSVDLSWDQDAGFRPDTYAVSKLTNGAAAGTGQSQTPTYTDDHYDTHVPTCYTISYKDLCGNASPASLPACPIQLQGTVQQDNSIVLTWSPYTGWANGVILYRIMKFDADGSPVGAFLTTSGTSYTDVSQDFENQVYQYRIEALPTAGGITSSLSNTTVEIKNPNLVYPSAFTPDGDGLNDRFIVYGRYVTGFEMSIFNRWGELMFSTGDLEDGWDGNYHGSPMPEGTYVFRARIKDMTGTMYDRSGSVLLMRHRE